VRNENALSVLQNNIATGKNSNAAGPNNRQGKSKIQNLAALLGDKSAFDQAFNNSMVVKPSNRAEDLLGNIVDALLEASRTFMIGDIEYLFDEKESIFFLEGPINPRNYHNTPEGCHTCKEKWKKSTDLQDSHCHFCGMSNCKKCLVKTRKFADRDGTRKRKSTTELNKSRRDIPDRGSICKLCDRKFLIKEMVHGSLDQITEQNESLSKAFAGQEALKTEIQEATDKHRLEASQQRYEISTLKSTITKHK